MPVQIRISLETLLGWSAATGDSIIAISEDDDTIVLSGNNSIEIQNESFFHTASEDNTPRIIIMLGWNWRAAIIVRELSNYLHPGYRPMLVADEALCHPEVPEDLRNLSVKYESGNTTDRSILESLSIQQYDHIILLSYSDNLDVQTADSSTLITLLHIRNIADKLRRHCSMVSEMRDVRNRNLAEITDADDYIVSDQLLSRSHRYQRAKTSVQYSKIFSTRRVPKSTLSF